MENDALSAFWFIQEVIGYPLKMQLEIFTFLLMTIDVGTVCTRVYTHKVPSFARIILIPKSHFGPNCNCGSEPCIEVLDFQQNRVFI